MAPRDTTQPPFLFQFIEQYQSTGDYQPAIGTQGDRSFVGPGIIDWIDHQPWSDHRVAMYGGSYTSWASTKRVHPALKTIVASASFAITA